MELHNKTDVQQ